MNSVSDPVDTQMYLQDTFAIWLIGEESVTTKSEENEREVVPVTRNSNNKMCCFTCNQINSSFINTFNS